MSNHGAVGLRTVDLKFYGQFEPPVARFVFERYFPELGIQGVSLSVARSMDKPNAHVDFLKNQWDAPDSNQEPVPWLYEKLVGNRPESRNLNIGLSNRTGTARFECVVHPTFGRDTTVGAIEHSPALREIFKSSGCLFEEIEVNVLTWGDFIEAEGISCIDLMVLDVEGHELEVLSRMNQSHVLPHVMCVEFG